ncbi:MAG: PAS-domain containing protein [Alphaproteobacteria bacterium]|nr:PAS-domain containing protein [Alphaproteobacteria bacterium]
MKPRLRILLAAAFIFVATVPLLILGFWVERSALENELSLVSEKHLLVAKNLTAALDRYAIDAGAAFGFFFESLAQEKTRLNGSTSSIDLGRNLGFRHVCIVESDGRVSASLSFTGDAPKRIPQNLMVPLRAASNGEKTVFSNVMRDTKGRATIFLVRGFRDGRLAIGALDLNFIRETQKSIVFGKRGHSAIVDKTGTVLAHPKPEWQESLKNISRIKPVARMIAGETGIETFYSPAMKSDMISGFSTVSRTGWGVMIPQPMSELVDHTIGVRYAVLVLILVGLVVAAALGWFISGALVRPVESVVRASREIESGNHEYRVPTETGFAPREFQELGAAFNAMARDIGTVMVQRERIEDELREARDDLERRVEKRTKELTGEIAERKNITEALRRSEERLRGAIESLQEGFALFDADDRLVALNKVYLDVSPGARDVMENGGTFEDVIRANVQTGKLIEAEEDKEAFIAERVRQHRNPGGPLIRRFVDGRWFMINEVRTPEGGIALSFIDITEIKKAEEALRDTQQRFKDFAEVASDWFWEMDKDLRFSYFSGRNFQVTGYKTDDLIGKSRREITGENVLEKKWQMHLEDLENHRPFQDFTYDLMTPSGAPVSITISGKPVFDAEGNFMGYRGTGTDISARVRAEEKQRDAREEAELANRAKTEFLANMSHELRTPLNSVIGFSDLLKSEAFGEVDHPKYLEYVDAINESGKHLLNLINDILDVSRIERGMLELDERKLDVPLMLGSCLRLVQDRAYEADLKLTTDFAGPLPGLYADELRTKQIILNLLSNAIKFTPNGGSVSLQAGLDDEGRFRIAVSDTGIGIAPEDIDIAFADFGQVDASLSRKFEGSGLGLPLSKKLTEAQGGEMFMESKPGVGTTVIVLLPKERTLQAAS